MKRKYHVERITDPQDSRLEYIYRELLEPNFLPDEIEPIEKARTLLENARRKTARNKCALIVAYHPNEEEPVSLLSGHLLGNEEEGYGAIGYIVTKEQYRRRGLASSLVSEFEKEVLDHTRNPRMVITEGTGSSWEFWEAKGYGKVQDGSVEIIYYQPPVDFDPESGAPVHEKVRETLRAKLLSKRKATEADLRIWLIRGIDEMSRVWFIPKRGKFKTKEAYKTALKHANETIQSNLGNVRNSSTLTIGHRKTGKKK